MPLREFSHDLLCIIVLKSGMCGDVLNGLNNFIFGGVLKSMLTLNEAIIDVKEG